MLAEGSIHFAQEIFRQSVLAEIRVLRVEVTTVGSSHEKQKNSYLATVTRQFGRNNEIIDRTNTRTQMGRMRQA